MAIAPEEQVRQRVRRIAFGLLAIGAVVVTAMDQIELMKQRMHVLDRRVWRLVEGEPGLVVAEAAVALLNATNGRDRHRSSRCARSERR